MMLAVSYSTSQSLTLMPSRIGPRALEVYVKFGMMASPPSSSVIMNARCKAVVHEVTIRACFTPKYFSNSRSNSLHFGPSPLTQVDRRRSTTASSSLLSK